MFQPLVGVLVRVSGGGRCHSGMVVRMMSVVMMMTMFVHGLLVNMHMTVAFQQEQGHSPSRQGERNPKQRRRSVTEQDERKDDAR